MWILEGGPKGLVGPRGGHRCGLAPGAPVWQRFPMSDVQRILVPTDFSEPATRAVDYAAGWAAKTGATVLLVHVLPSTLDSLPFLAMLSRNRTAELEQEQIEDAETKLAAEALRLGVASEHQLIRGHAADAILRTADEAKASMVVIGSTGRDGIERAVIGSVAERVVRAAPCPVLVVR
jgi:universal stress protein A